MKKSFKWGFIGLGIVVAAAIAYGIYYLNANGPVGTGYTAKMLCS
jgi:hypothetical protein